MFDDQEFGVLSEISFMSSKEVQAVVIHAQRRAMTGVVRTPFRNKTYKVSQAYSLVESGQLAMVD